MRRKILGMAASAVGIALVAGACAVGAQQRGAAEKVGERIDQAAKNVRRGAEDVGNAAREQFAKARTSVHNMGVESRIYGRIHWDKALTDARIELEMQDGGVVILRGVVPDEAAKGKAVVLAGDTVGVNRVVDQLTVAPTSETTKTTTTTTTTTKKAAR